MLAQLNTEDLRALMKDDPLFVGVFPSDVLPNIVGVKPFKMIINLDPSTQPGSHWVAVYRHVNGHGYYFDTFGHPPPPRIKHWLSCMCKEWKCFDKQIQLTNDRVSCGYICVTFLKKLPKN
jgi:hypothetical protein